MTTTLIASEASRSRAINANSVVSLGLAVVIIGAIWTVSGRLATMEQKQEHMWLVVNEMNTSYKSLTSAVTRMIAVSDERERRESIDMRRSTSHKKTPEKQ